MIIIYGTRTKLKIDKKIGVRKCENCHHTVEQALAREKLSFTLFYIPFLILTKRRMILCPCCGEAKSMSYEEYKQMKESLGDN
ncbi:MAG: zinc-ribbon domain-containing protein [Lachnospiraceae bacterium]|nr:zinc-ribbon domain-containing protein [Lachnospiraceae bacterium]